MSERREYRRITVALPQDDLELLSELARDDFRTYQGEASYLLQEAIRQRIAAKRAAEDDTPGPVAFTR